MSILNHNIYDNIRTRAIAFKRRSLLLNPPDDGESAWRLPGGGLRPGESMAECAAREVFEETGIQIRVLSIAFLREWVVFKYCALPEQKEGVGFGLEVYIYAHPINHIAEPRPERPGLPPARWMPLEEIARLPLSPKEIKALSLTLMTGESPYGVPSFVSKLESPWEEPNGAVLFNLPLE